MIGVVVRPVGTTGKLSTRVARAMKKAASHTLVSWKALARGKLRQTYTKYSHGIEKTEYGGAIKLGLDGALPRMLETGFPSYDMKPGLLRSPKARKGQVRRERPAHLAFSAKKQGTKLPKRYTQAGTYIIVPLVSAQHGPNIRGRTWTQGRTEFRTVTDQSKGWIHPGFAGVKLLPKVRKRALEYIKQEMSREFGRR